MVKQDPFGGMQKERALSQAIVDTIREPLLVLDKDLRVVGASRSFYSKFKVEREEVQDRLIYALGDGQWNIPELKLLLEEILPRLTALEAFEVEQDFPGIGRLKMLLNARKVFYEDDAAALILLSIEDVTERRSAEKKLADLMDQQGTLLREMAHRVANSLQIVASILSLKAQTVKSEESRSHLEDAHRRVMSVATVQQFLHAPGNLDRIEINPYLSRLCDALGASMIGDTRPITLKVHADNGTASSNEVVSIGLIVTELVINALKHAFVGNKPDGQIDIAYEVAGTNWRLTVSDNGIGKPKGDFGKTTPGLGTSIIEALTKQMDSNVKISMTPRGTTVSITHGSFNSELPAAA